MDMTSYIKAASTATLLDVLFAPVWYYTVGIAVAYRWLVASITSAWHMMGTGVWIHNIFTPMFQQHDWQGRIISFFMRLFQIIVRLVGFFILATALSAIFMIYLTAPLVLIALLFSSFM